MSNDLSPKSLCQSQDSAGAAGGGVLCTTILPASPHTLPGTILEHIQIMNYKIYYYKKNYRVLFITTWYKFTVFAVMGILP